VTDKAAYHHRDLKNALTAAGVALLAKQGVSGLTLRQAAKQAGVSHSAPYAHFADKQSLLAAVCAYGFQMLHEQLVSAIECHPRSIRLQMIAAAQGYVRFAMKHRELFKLMFSGVLQQQKSYPELEEVTRGMLETLVSRVAAGQQARLIIGNNAQLTAIVLWAQIHGLVVLALEDQIPSSLLSQSSIEQMVADAIQQNWCN
jgi:AcrR family transcriptional regulator